MRRGGPLPDVVNGCRRYVFNNLYTEQCGQTGVTVDYNDNNTVDQRVAYTNMFHVDEYNGKKKVLIVITDIVFKMYVKVMKINS